MLHLTEQCTIINGKDVHLSLLGTYSAEITAKFNGTNLNQAFGPYYRSRPVVLETAITSRRSPVRLKGNFFLQEETIALFETLSLVNLWVETNLGNSAPKLKRSPPSKQRQQRREQAETRRKRKE